MSLLFLLVLGLIAHAKEPVDLQIVFATDISGSIGFKSYRTQRDGLINALRDPEVQRQLGSGAIGNVGMVYFEWSGLFDQQVRVPWTIIHGETVAQDLEKWIAVLLEETQYVKAYIPGHSPKGSNGGGNTSIRDALRFTRERLLTESPFEATRTVIDVSGDGRENVKRDLDSQRDLLLAPGDVTINGIVILGQEDHLLEFYQQHVIGGPSSFALPVNNIADYGLAIIRKLRTEIAMNGGLSWGGSQRSL